MQDGAIDLRVERCVRFDGEGTLKAVCDLIVGERFLIKGLRVIEGKQGLFVSMPRQQWKDGKWYDTVRTLTKDAKAEVGRVILEAYHQTSAIAEKI